METSCFRNLCPFFLLRTAFVKCPFIYLVCLWIKKVWNYLAVLVDLVRANMLEYMALNHNPRRHCWTLVSLMASSQGVKLIWSYIFTYDSSKLKKKSKLKFLVFFKMITQSANIDKVYNYIVCKSTAILFEACWKYENSGSSKICLSFLKIIKNLGTHLFIAIISMYLLPFFSQLKYNVKVFEHIVLKFYNRWWFA